ncbi:DNA glycosylase AlkZ-like family protein [Microlunatus soli]|uniref:Winged helix DNA-binding domain-containing protein n=1 Tax=Microlunatus soli TaxID=630515 RepID=A0A1H1ZQG1_9ACTN|nr:crosslink repair DNA glycosylase YcaQ family protein [Microlunatus soli]SDT36035.1 Winged helix DNA-binding domain-containing protein [Microlunatus soli]
MPVALTIAPEQAVRYRLQINQLTSRLPAGSVLAAARFGLQDTAPRDALLGLHARMEHCRPEDWQHPGLIQTYSPRAAVHLLSRDAFGIFTLGRMPLDPDQQATIERYADQVCEVLAGRELRQAGLANQRAACASGRIALRWTTSALYVREVERPQIDLETARRALCRLHIRAFGPTTPATYAWWSGLSAADARAVWQRCADDLLPVRIGDHRAWILSEEEQLLRSAPEPSGVRLLVPSDLRLLGQDRSGLFVGPGQKRLSDRHDSFHPGGVLLGRTVVGAWGRRGGRVDVRLSAALSGPERELVEAEALAMPIPRATMSITISDR